MSSDTAALERINNVREYMTALLNVVELQAIDTTGIIADIEGNRIGSERYDYSPTFGTNVYYDSNILYPILTKDPIELDIVDGVYFCHPDHLGSATWITDSAGAPIEYIHYMPYGELWTDQQASAYVERYRFTGKERDSESGYDYFGARHYSSTFPMWLTVDPLSDSYPDISPYAYCSWNPVKYVDPDGKEKHNMMDPYSKDINQMILYEAGQKLVDKSNHIFFISHGSNNEMYPYAEMPMRAENFVSYLSENSNLWKTSADKSSVIIVLIACETAKGQNPIAKQISELLPETPIIAPTEEVKAGIFEGNPQIFGVAKKEAENLLEMLNPTYSGGWNAYKGGEIIGNSKNGNINYIYKDTF